TNTLENQRVPPLGRCRSVFCAICGAALHVDCGMNNNRRQVANHALLCPALALLACFSCSRLTAPEPEKLFANAFRVRRNLELRLPGVPHAKLVQERDTPAMNPELAEAEAMILRRLETESPPSSLLALQGRVHLLRSRWDLALDSARLVNEL